MSSEENLSSTEEEEEEEEDCSNDDVMNALSLVSESTEKAAAKQTEAGASLEQLSFDRKSRTFAAMAALDPLVAKETIPQDVDDKVTKAATTIQAYFRGYMARCKYLELLYDAYEKEEEERRRHQEEQLLEGEILLQNRGLEIAIEDNETAYKNKERRYVNNIITIQRAWRKYKYRKASKTNDACLDISTDDITKELPSTNVSADCSELEINEELEQGERKKTLLSMAQEFAELKDQFSEVLPYNAHKATLLSDSSLESSGSSSMTQTPSVEGISNLTQGTTLNTAPTHQSKDEQELGNSKPQLDRRYQEISGKSPVLKAKSVKDKHREDVRKRLAMSAASDSSYSEMYVRPPSKSYRGGHGSAGMELFVNECNDEIAVASSPAVFTDEDDLDLSVKQQKLQDEATMAYIQAGPIAKKLLEVEKMSEKPSPVASLLGVSSFRSNREDSISQKRLTNLSLPQLQVVFNGMRNEIEKLNEELVQCVVNKDELHMQQDSLLVNIEDLQRRADELSKKHQDKIQKKQTRKVEAGQERKRTGKFSRFFGLGAS